MVFRLLNVCATHHTESEMIIFFILRPLSFQKKTPNPRLFSFPSEISDFISFINFVSSFSTVVDFEQISVVDV